MKDEIKKILNDWKYVVDNKITVYGEELNYKEIKLLLDYITNLQERNEKAIKYIKKHTNNFAEYLDVYETKELSNILQGSDEE